MWLENTLRRVCRFGWNRKFQSFFFWMWLENTYPGIMSVRALTGFNPSSSGCGWKTAHNPFPLYGFRAVSILLLLDVAGKRASVVVDDKGQPGFNPSSSGCGWKTRIAVNYCAQ